MKNKDEIIIYQNNVSLSVRLENENAWLTQANLVELYQSSKSNVSKYIKQLDNFLSSTGESILLNTGSVSHKQAVEKVFAEYKKYQQKTFLPVEQAYLDTIKHTQKKTQKKKGKK